MQICSESNGSIWGTGLRVEESPGERTPVKGVPVQSLKVYKPVLRNKVFNKPSSIDEWSWPFRPTSHNKERDETTKVSEKEKLIIVGRKPMMFGLTKKN